MPRCVFVGSRGQETLDEGDPSYPDGSPADNGLVGDKSVGRQVSHHTSGSPGHAERPVPRPPPLPSNVPDLHFVYCDDRGCFRGGLPTENDYLVASTGQTRRVLPQDTLRAPNHFPWRHIGEQENFHVKQCNGWFAEVREFAMLASAGRGLVYELE